MQVLHNPNVSSRRGNKTFHFRVLQQQCFISLSTRNNTNRKDRFFFLLTPQLSFLMNKYMPYLPRIKIGSGGSILLKRLCELPFFHSNGMCVFMQAHNLENKKSFQIFVHDSFLAQTFNCTLVACARVFTIRPISILAVPFNAFRTRTITIKKTTTWKRPEGGEKRRTAETLERTFAVDGIRVVSQTAVIRAKMERRDAILMGFAVSVFEYVKATRPLNC